MFRAGNVDALKTTTSHVAAANNRAEVNIDWIHSPATIGTVTYTIRAGGSVGIARMNGNASGRLFGGTAACTLVAQEIKV